MKGNRKTSKVGSQFQPLILKEWEKSAVTRLYRWRRLNGEDCLMEAEILTQPAHGNHTGRQLGRQIPQPHFVPFLRLLPLGFTFGGIQSESRRQGRPSMQFKYTILPGHQAGSTQVKNGPRVGKESKKEFCAVSILSVE